MVRNCILPERSNPDPHFMNVDLQNWVYKRILDKSILPLCVIEIEGQRGKDDGLKHYLGVWQHSPFLNFSTLRVFHFRMRFLRHSFLWRVSKISVEPHQMYIYHISSISITRCKQRNRILVICTHWLRIPWVLTNSKARRLVTSKMIT